MRILVVEDDPELGQSLRDLLESLGHETALACNAPTAMRLFDSFQPETLIVDIVLPVFDGNLVAMEARRRSLRVPPIIALTSRPELAQWARFDRVLAKPICVQELLAYLAEVQATAEGQGDPERRKRVSAG